MSEVWFERDPLWFKHAVFYEIHIRGFFDGNDDGSGDFRGLIDKLDYLEWLGVDCLWLLPMYESPLRDGGYDISNFFAIHPDYGTVEDFREFVEQAHQRGMRVIADLVMNHTSADHPWFQESRDPAGQKANWYVWSDSDERYPDARVIFIDAEPSNWTLDQLRGEYYWHRFFHHQPDLNFDNPEVQEAMLEVLRFWLDLGIDGFRLDAVPYLFERDGTNGENLPESHEYLKRVRAEVDARYPDRLLLAEANQWPEDVVDYFGDGDECQMCFHFPVMPRMFMALRREDATPMDEIGMVHNVYLGDRDGVRPPMQWSGDRNAGFSRADWAQLYLQPLMDPVYGFQAVNVEAQLRTPNSLLRWMQRFIALRKEHPVFGLGTYEPLPGDNTRIFSHIRKWEDDVLLCVHNLARSAQAVQLDLRKYAGMVPVEMSGRTAFPPIGELPYLLTLAPRGFFWFQLRQEEQVD